MNANDFRDYMLSFLARTQAGDLLRTLEKGFKYIEDESFASSGTEKIFFGVIRERSQFRYAD